jgi:hypothetical protein
MCPKKVRNGSRAAFPKALPPRSLYPRQLAICCTAQVASAQIKGVSPLGQPVKICVHAAEAHEFAIGEWRLPLSHDFREMCQRVAYPLVAADRKQFWQTDAVLPDGVMKRVLLSGGVSPVGNTLKTATPYCLIIFLIHFLSMASSQLLAYPGRGAGLPPIGFVVMLRSGIGCLCSFPLQAQSQCCWVEFPDHDGIGVPIPDLLITCGWSDQRIRGIAPHSGVFILLGKQLSFLSG